MENKMKTAFLMVTMVVLLLGASSCEIVDPFLIALGLPLEVCDDINEGNSWFEDDTFNIRDEIERVSSEYADNVHATRVNDITVYMPNPPAGAGTASGVVEVELDGGGLLELVSFTNVPFTQLAGAGISLKDEITGGGAVTIDFNQPNVQFLLSQLQNPDGLPVTTTVRVRTSGNTNVDVPQGTRICARIAYQADVEI